MENARRKGKRIGLFLALGCLCLAGLALVVFGTKGKAPVAGGQSRIGVMGVESAQQETTRVDLSGKSAVPAQVAPAAVPSAVTPAESVPVPSVATPVEIAPVPSAVTPAANASSEIAAESNVPLPLENIKFPAVVQMAVLDIVEPDHQIRGNLDYSYGGGPAKGSMDIRVPVGTGGPKRVDGSSAEGKYQLRVDFTGCRFTGGPVGRFEGTARVSGSFVDAAGAIATITGEGQCQGKLDVDQVVLGVDVPSASYAGANLQPVQPLAIGWIRLSLNSLSAPQDTPVQPAAKEAAAKKDEAGDLANQGLAFFNQQKWPQAEAAYRKALEMEPAVASHHFQLGKDLGFQNKWSEAIGAYSEAIRLSPNEAPIHFALGLAYANLSNWPKAQESQQTAIRLDPETAAYHFYLGNALAYQAKWPDAEAAYSDAVRLDPKNAMYHDVLGSACYNQKKLAQAEAQYREAIRLEGANGLYHADLAGALFEQNRRDEALQEAKEAIRLGCRKHWVYDQLGI